MEILWLSSISAAARAACSGTGTNALRIGFGNAAQQLRDLSRSASPESDRAKVAGIALASSGSGNVTVITVVRARRARRWYSSGSSLPAKSQRVRMARRSDLGNVATHEIRCASSAASHQRS